jgi:hypothetical protein
MLDTKANPGKRFPRSSSNTKYFWLTRMEVMRISLGRARYFSSKRPASTTGYSTRFATVSTSGSSSTHFLPMRIEISRMPARIFSLRTSRSTNTSAAASLSEYSAVEDSAIAPGERNRCPNVVLPAVTFPKVSGITASPYRETIQWTGRANRTSRSAQRIDFLKGMAGIQAETSSGSTSLTGLAACFLTIPRYSPRSVGNARSPETSTPCAFAKPRAALVGFPSLS